MADYLTDEKVAVLGAAGAIGSNLVQSLLTSGTTSCVSMYDPFEKGLEGAAEEIYHCGFPGASVSWTTDLADALNGASYIITSGGAPRKEGMTREDLRRDNARIAEGLGKEIKRSCPACKLLIVIFNPADITGLTALVHSGLPATSVSTLAALDSTRLQTALSHHFGVQQDSVTGCRTYGGHGEQMAVFLGSIKIDGVSVTDALEGGASVNGKTLDGEGWQKIQEHVRGGGARIIELRGRSSFQSPAQQSVFMLRGALGQPYEWPCGAYVNNDEFQHIMMGMPCTLSSQGVTPAMPEGSDEDLSALRESYKHVVELRDQTISDGIIPPISEWKDYNPNLV